MHATTWLDAATSAALSCMRYCSTCRSCRARLSLHNNRRRKRGTASAGGDGGGRGRRARMRQRRAPALLQERRVSSRLRCGTAEPATSQLSDTVPTCDHVRSSQTSVVTGCCYDCQGAQPEELQQPHMGSLPRLLPQPGFRPPDDNGMTLGSAGAHLCTLHVTQRVCAS